MNLTKAFIKLGLIGLAGFTAIISSLLLYTSYEWFTAWILGAYLQPEKLEKFRSLLLTKERFLLLRVFSILLTCLFISTAIYFWNRQSIFIARFHRIWVYVTRKFQQAVQFWQLLSVTERTATIVLFVCIFLLRLYFLRLLPFHVDERFTYLYFVRKGLGVSMAYYPGPNNHILFTLLCNVSALFIDNPWWIMKIPAFLCGLGVTFFFWFVVRINFDFYTTFLSTVFFAFAGQVWYYGLQGRGYSLQMIFTLITMASAFSILQTRKTAVSTFFWLWLSSTLGFYTIPVFLYPFVGVITFLALNLLIKSEFKLLLGLSITVFLVAFSSFLLYLPVFIFNGWAAVSGNSWVIPMPWADFMKALPDHMIALAQNMWGFFPYGKWVSLLMLLFCIATLFSKRIPLPARRWVILFLVNLFVIVILCLLQRVLLLERMLIYLNIFQYLILAFALVSLIRLFIYNPAHRFFVVLMVSILCISTSTYAFYREITPDRFDLYDSFDHTAQLLFQRKADRIFVNQYEYNLCIRFQYETNERAIHMDTNQPLSGAAYNYLVIHKSKDFPREIPISLYKPIYSDTEVVVYEHINKILN